MRICPACSKRAVSLGAVIAAAVDSVSRCSSCGAGLKFRSIGRLVLPISVILGLTFGLSNSSYWIGGGFVLLGMLAFTLVPLMTDASDPISRHRELREKISSRKPNHDA